METRDSPHKFHDGDHKTLVWAVACFQVAGGLFRQHPPWHELAVFSGSWPRFDFEMA